MGRMRGNDFLILGRLLELLGEGFTEELDIFTLTNANKEEAQ